MPHFSIFGYYGQGNAGDEAILAALSDGIKKHISNATISVYSANITETENTHGIRAYRFFGLDPKSLIKGVLRKTRTVYIKSVFNFFKTDIVVIGGGGLFFDSVETNKWIYGYIDLIHRAKRFGKKVALIGISVGPLHHKESEEAIAKAFSRADLISVRDFSSKELLIKCGVEPNKINVIPDLVFTLSSVDESRIDQILNNENIPTTGKKNIALTPCCYNTKMKGWHEQYANLCEQAVTQLGANIWLIPMQRNENHDDLSAINEIVERLSESTKKQIFILKGKYNARETQGIIGKSDLVFAERLHGSIMAINSGVPLYSLAYMPKVNGVLHLAAMTDAIINMSDFLSGKLNFLMLNNSILLDKKLLALESNMVNVKKDAQSNFSKLAALESKA